MMRQEAAAQLRAEYKRAGWNSRMISVRSTRGEVRVTIKDVRVPHAKAKAMAEEYESIARDGYGEILLGGNLTSQTRRKISRRNRVWSHGFSPSLPYWPLAGGQACTERGLI